MEEEILFELIKKEVYKLTQLNWLLYQDRGQLNQRIEIAYKDKPLFKKQVDDLVGKISYLMSNK